KRFWDMAERVLNGTASDEDRETYYRVERHGVYYPMTMQDVLETDGSWDVEQHGASEAEILAEMQARVCARTDQKPEAVARALRHGLAAGFLRYEVDGTRCAWTWADEGPSMKRSSDVVLPHVAQSALDAAVASA